ncbi:VOC family protein [Histidinibacterium lentulum]|uniref:VOC family protein n=1 Tax=Histidinibacterium lentulum TaxID=2480588 RepID=A0A3N2QMB4_9RHOB|nr:VOC family protein [Histidinibacterium lentulum]ROT96338.1 VOC family protein [Histidinibacterium lentulum]
MRLDHLAVAASDLSEGVAVVEEALGVTLDAGGQHVRFGTHNRLLGLGDIYLEVIAPEPGTDPGRPRWFGLDAFEGPPRLLTWLCAVDDLDTALDVHPTGAEALALSRGDLSWRFGARPDGALPMEGLHPTFLEWAPGTRHPAERLPDRGCRLARLVVRHPQAATIPRPDDPRVALEACATGIEAWIETPHGVRRLP